jgi:uncharacterized hydrophobic protein (TIGR00271 family)
LEYKKSALFIYDNLAADWLEPVLANPFGTRISAVEATVFIEAPQLYIENSKHVVIAVSMELFEPLLQLANKHGLSLGFLPYINQKMLQRHLGLSKRFEDNLEVALRDAVSPIDLTSCNGRLMMFRGMTGMIPLVESYNADSGVNGLMTRLRQSIKSFFAIRIHLAKLVTADSTAINTALSGIAICKSGRSNMFSQLEGLDLSIRDSQLSALLVSPFSVMEYLELVAGMLFITKRKRALPSAVGVIKTCSLEISATDLQSTFVIDNTIEIDLPVTCNVLPNAISINAPDEFWRDNPVRENHKEIVNVVNLPDEKESQKYINRHITFFSSASEDRFKELFGALRDDASINSIYVTLMILSTMLATFGLFADSAAVVIGAMLLAPLMAPIVSFAMGLLRADKVMLKRSLLKIWIGVLLALTASSLLSFVFPDTMLTDQMKARTNPTLIDLAIAILSGITAAYSKSFKEILQSLAGVAIAVALVPPLSTAGIGLGRGEFLVFLQAFLLFFTNFIGISLAATFTFLALGFSRVVKSKRSIIAIAAVMTLIAYPLLLSFNDIINRHQVSKAMAYERFLVNDKYIIVKSASIRYTDKVDILDIDLIIRESMQREELDELKRKIESALGRELHINATMEYIL